MKRITPVSIPNIIRIKLRKNFRDLKQYVMKIVRAKKGKGSYTRKNKDL